jgi:hypothetical protein
MTKKTLMKMAIVAIAITAGIMISAKSKSVSKQVEPQAVTDTCGCYTTPPATTCVDSIKIIEWQGCSVDAVTIYEDNVDNNSEKSQYLALGTYDGSQRRIMLRIPAFDGIVDSFCINPKLGRIAQFDSVRLTLYVAKAECVDYTDTGYIFRLGIITDTTWAVDCTTSSDLTACETLYTGAPTTPSDTAATWRNYGKAFTPGTPRNWPLPIGYDHVEFICHRPQPDNPDMKTTISNWIHGTLPNGGWMIYLDSTQIRKENYALIFYSSKYSVESLRPKLTMYFTKGENRDDDPGPYSTTTFVYAPNKKD